MEISINHIDFSYTAGSPLIFRDFSLKANAGDIIMLEGASGSGKSTIFRLLLGFEKPLNGTLTYDGHLMQDKVLQDFRNHVAWLPQDLDLGEGTLEEVFYFPFNFKNNRIKKPSKESIENVFSFLGLHESSLKTNFKSLSTGQRQRVGIAICHFLDKEILLLDEPTSALDVASKERVKQLLFRGNKIILSASHDPWWLAHSSKIVAINPVL